MRLPLLAPATLRPPKRAVPRAMADFMDRAIFASLM
jgi:hypothetical protein